MSSGKVVRILSLDGGGMRGYLSAFFLQRFMQLWGKPQNEIWSNFDIIAGTSVGGIQACGYANGLSAVDMQAFFTQKGPWIFTIRSATDLGIDASVPSNRPNLLQKLYFLTIDEPFYKAVDPMSNYGDSRLKAELEAVFTTKTLQNLKAKVLITSYKKDTNTPVIWSNVNLPGYQGQTELAKNVAFSTGAAPVYLPPEMIGQNLYMDGGVYQNNPASLALSMAQMLYPFAKRYCVLSVGAGLGDIGFHEPTFRKELAEFRASPALFATTRGLRPKELEKLKKLDDINAFEGVKDMFSLIEIGIGAPQEAVAKVLDYQSSLTNQNLSYYRFQVLLDKNQDNELDRSDIDFFPYLEGLVDAQWNQDLFKISQFINMMADSCEAQSERTAA